MASAIGKEKFRPYMDKSFHLAFGGLNLGSPRLRESAFCFFFSMAEVLKDEFSPVLPQIVPILLETLKQDDLAMDKLTEDDARALLDSNKVMVQEEDIDSD